MRAVASAARRRRFGNGTGERVASVALALTLVTLSSYLQRAAASDSLTSGGVNGALVLSAAATRAAASAVPKPIAAEGANVVISEFMALNKVSVPGECTMQIRWRGWRKLSAVEAAAPRSVSAEAAAAWRRPNALTTP